LPSEKAEDTLSTALPKVRSPSKSGTASPLGALYVGHLNFRSIEVRFIS